MMRTYKLNEDYIKNHITDLLCMYNDVDCTEVLSHSTFKPQSFVVEDKRNGKPLLFFQDVSYSTWVNDMINDQLNKINLSTIDKAKVLEDTLENLEILMEYSYNDNVISSEIFNQEFVDVIRRVLSFTMYGDTESYLYTAECFNGLADKFMPYIIKELSNDKYNLKTLFLLSVASGVSGLDLKGSPAAASSYANTGIAMKQYLCMEGEKVAYDYLLKLHEVVNASSLEMFEWNEFTSDLENIGKLVWLTDDYIESHFDLIVISRILEQYSNIQVEIIPKNGLYGNDLSAQQLNNLVNSLFCDILNPFFEEGRLTINYFGPRMGAANIRKFSNECINSLKSADLLLLKGCRIHEMLQGGININSYSAFIVSRTLSEITTGLNSKDLPIVMFHLSPKEYAFWGILPQYSKTKQLSDGRFITMCSSTLSDHIQRKSLKDPEKIISEFHSLRKILDNYSSDRMPIYQEMNMLANKLVAITKETYDNMCIKYQEIRRDELHEMDLRLWNMLEDYIYRYIHKSPEDVKMLDVATGSGRDIMYAHSKGYDVFGVDNSDGFIRMLERLTEAGMIPNNSFAKNDMRSLQFEDCSFDVVRHNASLLHLPMIAKDFMADKAVNEAYRVLKPQGLFYVFVKKGDSLQFVDTGEGLGGRVFQFYTHESIKELLQRNGFNILYMCDEIEERPSGNVEWIAVIAQK